MLDVAVPVDAAAAMTNASTPTVPGLLDKLSLGVGLGSPLAFLAPLAALCTLSSLASLFSLAPIFLPALLVFCALYPLLSRPFPSVRQRAWLLTGVGSGLMTCASLPFVLDYAGFHFGLIQGEREGTKGWGVGMVQPRVEAAVAVNRVFQAYLTADMLIGALCYRSQIGFLTGWVHHIVYVGLTEIAMRWGWAHVFCLCAVMEVCAGLFFFFYPYPCCYSIVILFYLSLHIFLFTSPVICLHGYPSSRPSP
jgi:hypothetical protein